MNTLSHLLLGVAVFGRSGHENQCRCCAGRIGPEYFAICDVGVGDAGVKCAARGGVSGILFFSAEWLRIFAEDTSFILWGGLFVLGLWSKRAWLFAFAGAGLLHLATDFTLHHYDARRHFWPLSNGIRQSLISYWDSRFYGHVIAPIELLLAGMWELSLVGVVSIGH